MSAITGINASQQIHSSQTVAAQQKPAPSQTPEDSVHLSAAALKGAAGDVDHDGDSH